MYTAPAYPVDVVRKTGSDPDKDLKLSLQKNVAPLRLPGTSYGSANGSSIPAEGRTPSTFVPAHYDLAMISRVTDGRGDACGLRVKIDEAAAERVWLLHLGYKQAVEAIKAYGRPLTLHFLPRLREHGVIKKSWHQLACLRPGNKLKCKALAGQRFTAVLMETLKTPKPGKRLKLARMRPGKFKRVAEPLWGMVATDAHEQPAYIHSSPDESKRIGYEAEWSPFAKSLGNVLGRERFKDRSIAVGSLPASFLDYAYFLVLARLQGQHFTMLLFFTQTY